MPQSSNTRRFSFEQWKILMPIQFRLFDFETENFSSKWIRWPQSRKLKFKFETDSQITRGLVNNSTPHFEAQWWNSRSTPRIPYHGWRISTENIVYRRETFFTSLSCDNRNDSDRDDVFSNLVYEIHEWNSRSSPEIDYQGKSNNSEIGMEWNRSSMFLFWFSKRKMVVEINDWQRYIMERD